MKRYKSFILLGMLALSFTACSTDDLEQNIDALASRVEDMEKQVQTLNDNMNVIRVLLDGNKTIQTATEDQATGTWTLLLSNGETLTLTQGNTEGAVYPEITISDDGYWVIEGVKSDRCAEAENGQAATVTPQFRIVEESGAKVWQVSYDGGGTDGTWVYVTDESGNHVKATGTGIGTNPIKGVTREGDNLKITLSGDGAYTIPIVEGLVCRIVEPEGMENGTWYVTGTGEFTVTVSDDAGIVARVVAPVEWNASITESGAERTVSVTAPATPSECVLAVEVTKGVNTITDEIVVRTNVGEGGYYADFMAGLDIQIGNVKINKKMFGEDVTIKHVTSDETISSASSGVYFVGSSATLTYQTTSVQADQPLILIGDDSDDKGKVVFNSSVALNGNTLLFKDIEMTMTSYDATARGRFSLADGTSAPTIILDGCKVVVGEKANSSFVAVTGSTGLKEFSSYNSVFEIQLLTQYRILNVSINTETDVKLEDVRMVNNVLYAQNGTNVQFSVLWLHNNNVSMDAGADNLVVENNTFVNLHYAFRGIFNGGNMNQLILKDNIFYFESSNTANVQLLRTRGGAPSGNDAPPGIHNGSIVAQSGEISHNIGYNGSESLALWSGNAPLVGAESLLLKDDIFKTSSGGKFIPNDAYQDYGAHIEGITTE
ncbi:DUF4988 domain-containing protein [Bacteroides sp. ET225]|uniref:DUF4988 domain-containing protein n=1 Tax=Bacteroides sp. ET225 TaxID=2972461 RepID=UPI0021ABF5A1|nr:DUF4988 domain-containing protein [Bacteroides sp. ET225]MCR8919232.1 DUF4988 domain-containing protein [Bacteroides sp. ET225]